MLILDKNIKDYYDWYCSVLGVDSTVVYDRRDYNVLGGDSYNQALKDIFNLSPTHWDKKQTPLKGYYNSNSFILREQIKKARDKATSFKTMIKAGTVNKSYLEGVIYHIILEAGNTHYCFEIERYLDADDPNKVHIDPRLICVKEDVTTRYGGECPLSVIDVSFIPIYSLMSNNWNVSNLQRCRLVHNPILTKTFIPSFIPHDEMWRKIYDYLSSLKDKPIIDHRTNDEHIENAGFDKKDSFRPKKK